MSLYLKQIEVGLMQNFVYLIGSGETREVAVVDPAWEVDRILKVAADEGLTIKAAIVTHTHFDHINGVGELVEATDAPVYVHKKEVGQLGLQKGTVRPIEGEQTISLGGIELKFLHTPGHTPGSICIAGQDRLLAGDTLFVDACGRCDLPGGDPEQLYKSLGRLRRMDDHLTLYPGHNYAPQPAALLKDQKQSNPFLRIDSLNDFLGVVGARR
ncbi:MAG: MBL fold hydrolase [Candidatus Omnitrophica bacterium CG11_big_fil_rev_8_21_14_0_20_64_10]|nr:MAG: MBL fold hydrolase [Candidatus Omnitrophica bacterium CG11_big_fil_rev_8_21_14_0_20_64_10]